MLEFVDIDPDPLLRICAEAHLRGRPPSSTPGPRDAPAVPRQVRLAAYEVDAGTVRRGAAFGAVERLGLA
jgi:hypothetical protein